VKQCRLKFDKLAKRWYERISADDIINPYREILSIWNELPTEKREAFLKHSPNFRKLYEAFGGLE